MAERIQKLLASVGVGSRRQIEAWIKAGRLTVNKKPATLGQAVTLVDKFYLDDEIIKVPKQLNITPEVLLYHKPVGQICSHADPSRPTIFQFLPPPNQGRWVSIGRLDVNTSGLLLLTNHGELAARLMHPRYEIEREYHVRVCGEVTPDIIDALQEGIFLDDGEARCKKVKHVSGKGVNRWYQVILAEGKKREVRRLFEYFDLQVSRLMRVRYDKIHLPRDLKPGHFTKLSTHEIQRLFHAVGYSPR